MEKLKKQEAFKRAVAAFGEWRTWGRAQHLAYGLIRGVPYSVMERCSNDNPEYGVASSLQKLGAWPEGTGTAVSEVRALVVWVRKVPRGPRIRKSNRAAQAVAS